MKNINNILIIIFFLFLAGCRKEESGKTVSVTGFVRLIQEDGIELTERSGINVSVSRSDITSVTDNYGKFNFYGLEAFKRYTFEYSMEGFGKKMGSEYWFAGDKVQGLVKKMILYQIPTNELVSLIPQYNQAYRYINLYGVISGSQKYIFAAFVNDSSNVSESHFDNILTYLSSSSSSFSYNMSLNQSYSPGTRLYIIAYLYNVYEYEDSRNSIVEGSATSSKKKVAELQIVI